MIIEWKNYRFRLHCSLRKCVKVEGVNSIMPNSKHILMWDFDNVLLTNIYNSLEKIQSMWELPTIYIVESSSRHYHAYCLQARPYPEVLNILASTDNICSTYFKFGVIRGYWTLRITSEKGKFKRVGQLSSRILDDTNLLDLETVKYRTEV